jgi:SAM-dependent methyltransferase
VTNILEKGKDGYECNSEFDERTRAAVEAVGSEWGDPRTLLHRDAVEVLSFVRGDYQAVAPLLAALECYRLLDLGCGYGRLAPLLTAFDCAEYLGVDRIAERLDYARSRYGSYVCRFELDDALEFEADDPFDVVWTSNVMQHLLLPEKLRLVEAVKRARAPGGVILLREEEIVHCTRADAERRYASPAHARHMVPIPFDELAAAFRPLALRHLGGIVYAATER